MICRYACAELSYCNKATFQPNNFFLKIINMFNTTSLPFFCIGANAIALNYYRFVARFSVCYSMMTLMDIHFDMQPNPNWLRKPAKTNMRNILFDTAVSRLRTKGKISMLLKFQTNVIVKFFCLLSAFSSPSVCVLMYDGQICAREWALYIYCI